MSKNRTEFVQLATEVIRIKNMNQTGVMYLSEAQEISLIAFNEYCEKLQPTVGDRVYSDEVIKWLEWRQFPTSNQKPKWIK